MLWVIGPILQIIGAKYSNARMSLSFWSFSEQLKGCGSHGAELFLADE